MRKHPRHRHALHLAVMLWTAVLNYNILIAVAILYKSNLWGQLNPVHCLKVQSALKKAWCHSASTARKQREMDTGAPLISPFHSGWDVSRGNGATHNGSIAPTSLKPWEGPHGHTQVFYGDSKLNQVENRHEPSITSAPYLPCYESQISENLTRIKNSPLVTPAVISATATSGACPVSGLFFVILPDSLLHSASQRC